MDLLSNLQYSPLDSFYISVHGIKYGWMDISVATNDKYFNYSASYLSDPLEDLLDVAVALVKQIGDKNEHYFQVTHELEPELVTWLFKCESMELTVIIWENMPVNFEELFEGRFNDENFNIEILTQKTDISAKLCFAMRGSLTQFIKTLINTFEKVSTLKKSSDDGTGEWGFSYSLDKFEILKEWLLTKNIKTI